ncbi:hypothetical protein EV356DRAFT_528981 [Viridothelium virens]|uniref:Uncharacterized protein n=1 Tax=Viridothelium virens TaxID=1048519 RepID=A0A6A6HLU6_VIRVR|nr:hypothetical protein EV356DRAFT_528981 [Viridothelium virens]
MSAQPGTETPLKPAYAGPTFHASPAASSLPVPRFVSKSVPTNVEQPGLQARLNEESDRGEGPASSSGTTPKLAPTVPSQDRGPTPIDFLLDADRREKARAGSRDSGSHTPDRDPFFQQLTSESSKNDQLPENVKELPMHHSRSPSNRGMFPMELDGAQTENSRLAIPQGTPDRSRMPVSRSNTEPSKLSHADSEAAAQTLKSILGVPTNVQSPPGAVSNPFSNHGTASPQLHRNHSSNPSVPLSGSPTPPVTPSDGARLPPADLRYGNRNLSPLFQAARAPPPNRPSSGLRQQVEQEPPPAPAELPATNGLASPLSAHGPQQNTSPPPNPHFDVRAFSRAYLDKQIQAANPTMPSISLPSHAGNSDQSISNAVPSASLGREPSPFNSPSPASASSSQQDVLASGFIHRDIFPASHSDKAENKGASGPDHRLHNAATAAPNGSPVQTRSNHTQDVKTMEDSLRKILNLHAVGSQDGSAHPQ